MADNPYSFYLKQVQRLVGYDQHEAVFNVDDLLADINVARSEVAAQGQCIRILTPSAGQVFKLQVVNAGSGYTAPTLTISAPDAPSGERPFPAGSQATGTVQQIAGGLVNANVSFGGAGYFQPSVTVNDPHGSGGVVTASVSPLTSANEQQETYRFEDVSLAPFPGVASIFAIRSVSMLWNNWQWSTSRVGFSKYQALIRQYVSSFQAPPVWVSQFGQGTAGSIKMYPLPDQKYQMQWDCLCLPIDLIDDTSYEAIPRPWTNAVQFYAAHLALLGVAAKTPQFLQLALSYFNERTGGLFNVHMRRARAFVQPGVISSFYGRV